MSSRPLRAPESSRDLLMEFGVSDRLLGAIVVEWNVRGVHEIQNFLVMFAEALLNFTRLPAGDESIGERSEACFVRGNNAIT